VVPPGLDDPILLAGVILAGGELPCSGDLLPCRVILHELPRRPHVCNAACKNLFSFRSSKHCIRFVGLAHRHHCVAHQLSRPARIDKANVCDDVSAVAGDRERAARSAGERSEVFRFECVTGFPCPVVLVSVKTADIWGCNGRRRAPSECRVDTFGDPTQHIAQA
jgi:hypothetical protein